MEKKVLKNIIYLFVLVLSMILIPSIIALLLGVFFKDINENILLLIGNLFYLLVLVIFFNKTLIKEFGVYFKNFKSNFFVGIKYWAIGMAILFVSNLIINLLIFPGTIAENESVIRQLIKDYPLFAGLSTIIIAPITEELIFRAGFRKIFNNKWLYVLFSGGIFGLMHIVTDLSPILKIIYIIPYGALGCAFAFMHYNTKSIYTSIIMHTLHNALTFSLLLIFL